MVPQRPFQPTEVSRRQLLLTTGTFVAGGSVVAAAGSERVKGSITTTELQIPPAEYRGNDGSVVDLHIEVLGNYEYKVPNGTTVTLTLAVAPEGDESNYQTIDETSKPLAANSGAGSYTLAGSLLEHDALDAAMFSADPEQTTTVELPIRVLLDITTSDGETVVEALAETVATIRVENTSISASAAVMGEGEIAIEV